MDVEAEGSVAVDGVVEDGGVVGDGEDGGFDAVGGEEAGEVYHGDQVAAADEREEED